MTRCTSCTERYGRLMAPPRPDWSRRSHRSTFLLHFFIRISSQFLFWARYVPLLLVLFRRFAMLLSSCLLGWSSELELYVLPYSIIQYYRMILFFVGSFRSTGVGTASVRLIVVMVGIVAMPCRENPAEHVEGEGLPSYRWRGVRWPSSSLVITQTWWIVKWNVARYLILGRDGSAPILGWSWSHWHAFCCSFPLSLDYLLQLAHPQSPHLYLR
jgi:hypothetical protein